MEEFENQGYSSYFQSSMNSSYEDYSSEEDRFVSATKQFNDDAIENVLRPKSMTEYI